MEESTKFIIELTWLESNKSIFSSSECFDVVFYRFTDNIHEVKSNALETKKIIDFLTKNEITFKLYKTDYDECTFIKIGVKSDVFIHPNHHIELRVREIINNLF